MRRSQHGVEVDTVACSSHDPAADLDHRLIAAGREIGGRPDRDGIAPARPPEYFFASNAGAVASHAEVSVFVVR